MLTYTMFGVDDLHDLTFYQAFFGRPGRTPGGIKEDGRCFQFTPIGIIELCPPAMA